ncbi:MAG: flavin reductase family protein [Euryarchaeota archaeon]|nr:flavin reductase family protein [Euryarchaeota archaeon]
MPVVVMGANVKGRPNYCTVAWATMIDDEPPVIGLVLGKGRKTMEGVLENETFSVNVPDCQLAPEVDHCGLVSGRKEDKSEVFSPFYGSLGTAPMARECPVNIECRLKEVVELEATDLVMGDIMEVYVNGDCMEGNRPDILRLDPLLYAMPGGPYFALGDKVADAFKVGKGYKKK